jgi:hypothetical protein
VVISIAVILTWRISSPDSPSHDDGRSGEINRIKISKNESSTERVNKPRMDRKPEPMMLVEIEEVPQARKVLSTNSHGNTLQNKDGRSITLNLKGDSPILNIIESPLRSKYLVCQGAQRLWSVYNQDGEHLINLPNVSDIAPALSNTASVGWSWRSEESLLASLEIYEYQDPSIPKYPDSDSVPLDIEFYDYNLQTYTLFGIHVPERLQSTLLRLEGISEDGVVIISSIASDGDYWGERSAEDTHAFKITDTP